MIQGKNLIITHKPDIDGWGGAVIAKIFDPNIEIILAEIGELDKVIERLTINGDLKAYTRVFIVDLPLRDGLADKIDEYSNPNGIIVHFDHHTSDNYSAKYGWSTVQSVNQEGIEECGTKLFHEYLLSDKHVCDERKLQGGNLKNITQLYSDEQLRTLTSKYAYYFVELTRSYDTWNWHNKKPRNYAARDLNYLAIHLGAKEYIDYFRKTLIEKSNQSINAQMADEKLTLFNPEQQIYINAINKDVKDTVEKVDTHLHRTRIYVPNGGYRNLDHYITGVVLSEKHRSEVGSDLSEKHFDDIQFVTIVDFERGTISFRTEHTDTDVGKIAKEFGGGGKLQTAGIPIKAATVTVTTENNQDICLINELSIGDKMIKSKIDGYNVGIILSQTYYNSFQGIIPEQEKQGLDFIVVPDFYDKNITLLRTNKQIDLSKYANIYGGSGTKDSANIPILDYHIVATTPNDKKLDLIDTKSLEKDKVKIHTL